MMRRQKRRPVQVWRADAELLGAARVGDEEAWEVIITRYQSLIDAISRRYRLGPDDAHDVSQYVWMQLVGHVDRLREPRALPGWISTTTTHRCYEVLRTQKRSVSVDPVATSNLDLIDTRARCMEGEGFGGVDEELQRIPRSISFKGIRTQIPMVVHPLEYVR